VEREDAAHGEDRPVGFVDVGELKRDGGVGQDVAVQGEAHAKVLGESVRGVEEGDVVRAGEGEDAAAIGSRSAERMLGLVEIGVEGEDDGLGPGIARGGDGDELSGAEVEVALDLAGREPGDGAGIGIVDDLHVGSSGPGGGGERDQAREHDNAENPRHLRCDRLHDVMVANGPARPDG
jgi:hypothetical protein